MAKFMTPEGIKDILRSVILRINEMLDIKVETVTSSDPDEIFVDNTDPNNLVIGLGPSTKEALDKLWEEVFGVKPITIGDIPAAIQPVTGTIPTMTFDNSQWTGTISWNPIADNFEPNTQYEATITIHPKQGYTLEDVYSSIFNIDVSGVTLSYDDGIITILFPLTEDIIIVKEDTPQADIDFIEEFLTELEPNSEYIINSETLMSDSSGKIHIDSDWIGSIIDLIKKSTNPGTIEDSNPQTISIPPRPNSPELDHVNATVGNSDGSILMVDSTMEYKTLGIGYWVGVVGTVISGLSEGTYEVRIAPVQETSFASLPTIIAILEESDPIPVGGWELTYSYTGSISVIVGPSARVPLADWVGYDGTQIIDEDEIYSEDLVDMNDIKLRLYAKFITDDDFKEVYFDNFGQGTSLGNHMQRWGYGESPAPYIQLIGSNSTGVNVELRLVKEA